MVHLTEAEINDLADGTLAGSALSAAEAHVQSCADCRRELEAVRAVLARLSGLPAEISPDRDLRPHIWAQAERRTLWSWRYPLAAAAVVLIAVSSVLTATLLRGPEELPVTVVATPAARPPLDLVSLEQEYHAEAADLQRMLAGNRTQLAPETVRILEENLRIIDTAIQEARAALARDPQSAALGEMWRSAYQRKLELLEQAARSTAGT
jgi:hypothetical protein